MELGMKRGDYTNKFEASAVDRPLVAAGDMLLDLHDFVEDCGIDLPNKIVVYISEDR